MYQISTTTEARVSTDSSNQSNPDIFGDYMVWQDNRHGNDDIYLYQISTATETQITTNSANQNNPAIYGNNVVFQDDRNGNYDIYLHASQAQSTQFTTTSGSMLSATLTATDVTPAGTNIDYYMSNDNGTTWEAVTSGVEHTFSSSGTQPKWKALLTHTGDISAIPYISNIAIDYTVAEGGRRHPIDPIDITPPENITSLDSASFPYSLLGSEIILMWTNPAEEGSEDYAGVDIYSSVGNCKDLEFKEFKKIGSTTTPQAYSYPVFGIKEPEKNHCFAIYTRDITGNINPDGFWEDIVPGDTVKTFDFKNQEIDETDTIETITKLTQEKTKDLIETYEAFDNKKHNLFLAQEAQGKFLELTEYGYSPQIYYVSTQEKEPHRYLFNSETMLDIFGKLSLGITNDNLIKLSDCNSGKPSNPFNFSSSTLLLNVTKNGEVSYFDKQNNCRESINWDNIEKILPTLTENISIKNLQLIPFGEAK